jgi:hypothetical protein
MRSGQFLILSFLLLIFTGCGNFPFGMGGNNIRQLQRSKNFNSSVSIQGKVIAVAPFIKGGAYELSDQSGSIWVVTNQKLPDVGMSLSIQGNLQFQSITVEGQEFGEVYIKELQR